MFSHVLKRASSLRSLKPAAFTIGVATKTSLGSTEILRGLSAFQEAFPELTEFDLDQNEGDFVLANGVAEYEKQLSLRVWQSSVIDFSWGPDVAFGSLPEAQKVIDTIQDGFS